MRGKSISLLKQGVKVFSAAAVSIVILSVFSLVYNYTGVHISNPSGATDYKWISHQRKAAMTEGFAWLNMDASGFNNQSKPENTDILLMGSSHMEAVNVAADENTGALLNRLTGYNVYNIGMARHNIYACANNLSAAVGEYDPSFCTILETSTVCLDPDTMSSVTEGSYPHMKSYESGLMYMLQKNVPAVKNIYRNLTDWKDAETLRHDSGGEKNKSIGKDYYNILKAFLIKASADADNRLVIFYHPDVSIDKNGNFLDKTDKEYSELFGRACAEAGICFIDMTEDYRALYERDHVLPHGFINTAVGTGHLNRYGHEEIAKRLIKELLTENGTADAGNIF